MNTLVSFEIAKLLKEKGFDLLWVGPENWNNQEDFLCYAPTIAEVVMWLYEKHEMWVSVEASILLKFNYIISKKEATKLLTIPFTFEVINAGYDYKSPTEAYEVAILYTLNNLI